MTANPIAQHNNAFRQSFFTATDTAAGRFIITQGVAARGVPFQAAAIRQVHEFDAFTPDNDPYGEHDFGSLEVAGQKLFWKIDCYAKDDFTRGSEDPADPAKTTRVLTVMLASEY